MTDSCLVFGIVEGQGDVEALPALLTRIDDKGRLRLGKSPAYRLRSGLFLNDKEEREGCFAQVRRLAADALDAGQRVCVLILMDADKMGKNKNCCKEWLNNSNQAAEIFADIGRIFAGIPSLLVLAEKGYESWLVAGLDGSNPGDPKDWLKKHRQSWTTSDSKSGSQVYKEVPDQKIATSSPKFNLDLAAKKNRSFRRLRERLLKMAEGG